MPALSRLLRPVLAAGSEAIVHRQLDDDIGVY
jgi:hypothetical protein